MPPAVITKIIIVSAFSLDGIFGGEPYQFFLDVHDMLDSSWIQTKYNVIGTRVQCASLCYQHRDECSYFGYKAGTCYLLKDTVDRNVCSQDDCTNSGMKIYKWGVDDLTTTTTKAPTTVTTSKLPATTTKITETTSTSTTTTTDIPKTTTTEVPSTTKTKVSSTTTNKVPLTTTTTTTKAPSTTTTTEVPSTRTTEIASTTTTTKAPTTTTTTTVATTEAGTMTTTTKAGTTITSDADTTTTEAGTTTTTEAVTTTKEDGSTTTTDMSTTTTTTEEPTTTTEGAFSCPSPPHGAEPEIICPTTDYLLRQMGSKSPFFGDALGATCTPMNEQIYEDEKDSRTFYATNGALPLNTYCPYEHHIVASFKLCIVAGRLLAATLDCHLVKDPQRIIDKFNKSTTDEDGFHQLVNCEEKGAIQAIYFTDSDKPPIVKVDFSCVKIRVDNSIEDVPPAI